MLRALFDADAARLESLRKRKLLPERHRSLRAVFDYSRKLLAVEEQAALAQMAVFRATFSREAAQAVTNVALPQLAGLVNKSLLRTVAPGRYAMHELVRQFAAESLHSVPDAQEVERRHARYYLNLVARQEGLFGQAPHKAVAQILQELDDAVSYTHLTLPTIYSV